MHFKFRRQHPMTNSGTDQNTNRPPIDIVRQKASDFASNLSEGSVWHHRIGTFVTASEIVVREYAPNAHYVSLIGDFNLWDRDKTRSNAFQNRSGKSPSTVTVSHKGVALNFILLVTMAPEIEFHPPVNMHVNHLMVTFLQSLISTT